MTKEQELECNIAAAELLGHSITLCDRGEVIFIPIKLFGVDTTTEFNIFDNPADCLAVVKKLGEMRGISFYNNGGVWAAVVHLKTAICERDTYKEAVAAAVMECEKVD